jgi:hypothetical protein
MKMLYKYPQNAFPYEDLLKTNAERSKNEPEYELIDTGIFDHNEYFDIFIEYAKESQNDILIKVTVVNKSEKEAALIIYQPSGSEIHGIGDMMIINLNYLQKAIISG